MFAINDIEVVYGILKRFHFIAFRFRAVMVASLHCDYSKCSRDFSPLNVSSIDPELLQRRG